MKSLKSPLLFAAIVFLTGCSHSVSEPIEDPLMNDAAAQALKTEIDAANYCEKDSDCAFLWGECPFGCHIIVNAAETERVQNLMTAYQEEKRKNGGAICAYSCTPQPEFGCVSGKCQALSAEF